jgi:hypothetical protein
MERFKCHGCNKQMPGQVLKPMVHISERDALVVLLCPSCQQKYGDHNPNYRYANVTPAAAVLEYQKLIKRRSCM